MYVVNSQENPVLPKPNREPVTGEPNQLNQTDFRTDRFSSECFEPNRHLSWVEQASRRQGKMTLSRFGSKHSLENRSVQKSVRSVRFGSPVTGSRFGSGRTRFSSEFAPFLSHIVAQSKVEALLNLLEYHSETEQTQMYTVYSLFMNVEQENPS